jgi:tetratricopeptide (TPR) repeat protein
MRLTPAEMRRRGRPPTVNLDAYELYLRAGRLSAVNPEQNRESMTLLRRAIALDSGFARAHYGLAVRYLFLAYGRGAAYLDSGVTEARASIAADPGLPQGYFALADLQAYGGRVRESRASFLKALELNPSYEAAMQDLGIVEDLAGRYDEALHWAARALPISPNSANSYYHVEGPLARIGTDSVNERYFKSALDQFPDNVRLELMVARLDILRGRDSSAMTRARQVLERNPKNQEARYFVAELATITDSPDAMTFIEPLVREAPDGRGDFLAESYRAQLGRLLAKHGDRTRADSLWTASAALARQQLSAGNENPALPMEIAAISAIRGDSAAAFASLEQSYTMGWRDPRILGLDPFFSSLRQQPRFRKLIARMKTDVETMRRAAAAAHPQLLNAAR